MTPPPTERTALISRGTSSLPASSGAIVVPPLKVDDIEQCPPPPPEAATDDPAELKPASPEQIKHRPFREIAIVCFALWTSVFAAALSASVVANLMADISSAFKAGHLASWLGGAYLLGNAALTPLWGRLANIIGRRQAILAALASFVVGTAGCALAPSMMVLLWFRFLAGCGGGGMLTITAIIVSDLVSLQERGLYQGYVNTLFGAGSATGAVLGGWVGDRFGWRWAFAMQLLPLAISYVLILWKVHVPHSTTDQTARQLLGRIDWAGFALILTSVTALMLSLSLYTASGYPLSHPLVLGLGAVCLVSTVAFYFVEERADEPLIPMQLLKERTPALVLSAFLFLTVSTFARLFMIPLYLHVVRGFNGSKTGLVLLPSTITGSLGSLYAGWHMRRFGTYKTLSVSSAILPLLAAASVVFTWSTTTSVWRMAVECAIASWGGGVTITTFLTALIASVDKSHLSVAVSSSYLFRSIGQVLGVSVTGAFQQWALDKDLQDRLGAVGDEIRRRIVLEPSKVLPDLEPAVYQQAILSYLYSIEAVFVFTLVIGALMVLCATGMRSYALPGR